MLVSRENSVDCRSEPDSTMQLAGGSQDRLAVPAMTVVPANSAGGSTGAVTSSAPMAGDSSPTDPAVRRRRLSNLYKVRARKISVNQYSQVRVSNFVLLLFLSFSLFVQSNRSQVLNILASASIVWKSRDQRSLSPLPKAQVYGKTIVMCCLNNDGVTSDSSSYHYHIN